MVCKVASTPPAPGLGMAEVGGRKVGWGWGFGMEAEMDGIGNVVEILLTLIMIPAGWRERWGGGGACFRYRQIRCKDTYTMD